MVKGEEKSSLFISYGGDSVGIDLNLDVSVVIPVYGAADTLEELYCRLREALSGLQVAYEIIMVDDCSWDQSWKVITDLTNKDNRLKGIRLKNNQGQHMATWVGIREARGSWVVTMDDDLEHPPEIIPLMWAQRWDADVIFAAADDKKQPGWKEWGGGLIHRLLRVRFFVSDAGFPFGSFRLLSPSVIIQLRKGFPRFFYFNAEILAVAPRRHWIAYLPNQIRPTRYSLKNTLGMASRLIWGYTDWPQRFGLGGLILGLTAVFAGTVLIISWMQLVGLMTAVIGLGLGLSGQIVTRIQQKSYDNVFKGEITRCGF